VMSHRGGWGLKNMGESSSKVKKTSPLKRQKISMGHVQRSINGDESSRGGQKDIRLKTSENFHVSRAIF
jgi:hypothetical protein